MNSKVKFYSNKLVITTKKGEETRYYSNLVYASFFKPHCLLNFSDGSEFGVVISISDLLKNLPEKPFFQCNRSDIINLGYYMGYDNEKGMALIEGANKFEVSSRRRKSLKEKKDNLKCLTPQCLNCSESKKGSCRDYWLFSSEHDSEDNRSK